MASSSFPQRIISFCFVLFRFVRLTSWSSTTTKMAFSETVSPKGSFVVAGDKGSGGRLEDPVAGGTLSALL
jgi:hypothetical protein